MRTITDHKIEGIDSLLDITVTDEPADGGANHVYEIEFGNHDGADPTGHAQRKAVIKFQKGPVKEAGCNGITGEALIAIVIDRQRSFQAGPFSSADNQEALVHLESALAALQKRTRERLARGVEGTSVR